jgi:hypothetical protein
LVKDPEAWDWLCGYWVSDEFIDVYVRAEQGELEEQVLGAPIQLEWIHPQDAEDGMKDS